MLSEERIKQELIDVLSTKPPMLKTHAISVVCNRFGREHVDHWHVYEAANKMIKSGEIIYVPHVKFELKSKKEIKMGPAGKVYNNRLVVMAVIKEGKEFGYTSKEYVFFASEELDLQIGDDVVVDTRYGYAVGSITSSEPTIHDSHKACKWVVAKINVKDHEERMAREKKIFDLKQAMTQRLSEVEESLKLQRLAQMDPVMAEMYQQLSALDAQTFPALASSESA